MSSKQDHKMLKELAGFTKDTLKELKTRWAAIPAKAKARARRKIRSTIIERKMLQAQRAEVSKTLPTSL